jgi:hypothetical protein
MEDGQMENRMMSKLNVVQTPSFSGVRGVLKRCLVALVDPGPVSTGAAADWVAMNPLMQYRFSNFDLYLMDQYRDGSRDAESTDRSNKMASVQC